MMSQRPDLSHVTPDVVAYIEALEKELAGFQASQRQRAIRERAPEPSEPPTTINVVTISAGGLAKRTPRHLYGRQRRGGMGVFDLEAAEGDPPAFLLLADEETSLTLVTDQGRVFRLPMAEIPQSPVNDRGQQVLDRFPLREGEVVSLVFADPLLESKSAYLALVTRRGQVRRIGSQYLGKHLQDGTVLHNVAEGGAPAAACWTSGNDELFIVTQTGKAIRFAERLVPVRGCLGMRVDPSDMIAGIAAARPEDGVFMLSSEGKGTVRLLSGFGANKSPGAGGKIAMRAEKVVDVVAVDADYDLFAISLLGKIIRFRAEEIPAKEGVVQGVNCMSLRADECVAIVGSPGRR